MRTFVESTRWGALLSFIYSLPVNVPPIPKKLIRRLHRHATEIRNEMSAICVASNAAFGTPAGILATKGKHVATVAAPVGTHVGERLKSMWDAMVDFLFVAILVWLLGKNPTC